MSDLAIQAQGLGKRYRLGETERYRTFRETLVGAIKAPFRRASPREPFWALRDVSFDVQRGEVVGVIGRNGAGKSTLLKVLSRITEPSAGLVDVYGRVGSLLEVGTGFHNELSGRDNIYLNGSILGMKRAEIRSKFDEIVAFSECERFLDTPVKRYSSGMYMRLAFAVAAHLEPEILVVDEVLAVGDAAFQRKCLGKMNDVASHGRTVLFVSHNMAAVQGLCKRAILLEGGRLVDQGAAGPIVQRYLGLAEAASAVPLADRADRRGDGAVRLTGVRVESDGGGAISSTSGLRISIDYAATDPAARDIASPRFIAAVFEQGGAGIYSLDTDMAGPFPERVPARGTITCVTDPIHLTPGRCFLHLELWRGSQLADEVGHAAYFDIEGDDFYGTGKLPERDWVHSLVRHKWAAEGATG